MAAIVLLWPWAPFPAAAGPIAGAIYLSEVPSGRLLHMRYAYDGDGVLSASPPALIAQLPRGGGVIQVDGSVYVTGAGLVMKVDPYRGTFEQALSGNNANVCAANPGRDTLYCGWTDALSLVPLAPFGPGNAIGTTGDDTLLTQVAFTPAHGAFYSTGEIVISGNIGRLILPGLSTQRLHTAISATAVSYDSFGGMLLVAGNGRAHQIDPALPHQIASSRNDQGAGENYLSLTPTGEGHAFGTRLGEGRIVFLDYSASGLVSAPSTRLISMPIPGLGGLSGQIAIDSDRLLADGFETEQTSRPFAEIR
jgi:hypothetical protein